MAKLQLHVKQICGRASRQTLQTKKMSFEKIVSPGSQVFKNHSCNSCQSSSKLSILPFDLLYFLCCIYLFFMFWVVIFIGLLNFVTVPTLWILMSWSSAGFKIVPYWWATLVLNSLLLFLFSPIFLREFLCNFLLFQSLFPRLTKQ